MNLRPCIINRSSIHRRPYICLRPPGSKAAPAPCCCLLSCLCLFVLFSVFSTDDEYTIRTQVLTHVYIYKYSCLLLFKQLEKINKQIKTGGPRGRSPSDLGRPGAKPFARTLLFVSFYCGPLQREGERSRSPRGQRGEEGEEERGERRRERRGEKTARERQKRPREGAKERASTQSATRTHDQRTPAHPKAGTATVPRTTMTCRAPEEPEQP